MKNRGARDILIAAVDGLSGFPDAVKAVFPDAEVHLCMVHTVRNPVKYVPYKDRKAVTSDLKEIYLAPSANAAESALSRYRIPASSQIHGSYFHFEIYPIK